MIDDVSEMTAEWFVELMSAERIEDLWPDFIRWLDADPAHRRAFRALEVLWHLPDYLPAQEALRLKSVENRTVPAVDCDTVES